MHIIILFVLKHRSCVGQAELLSIIFLCFAEHRESSLTCSCRNNILEHKLVAFLLTFNATESKLTLLCFTEVHSCASVCIALRLVRTCFTADCAHKSVVIKVMIVINSRWVQIFFTDASFEWKVWSASSDVLKPSGPIREVNSVLFLTRQLLQKSFGFWKISLVPFCSFFFPPSDTSKAFFLWEAQHEGRVSNHFKQRH